MLKVTLDNNNANCLLCKISHAGCKPCTSMTLSSLKFCVYVVRCRPVKEFIKRFVYALSLFTCNSNLLMLHDAVCDLHYWSIF